MITSFETILEMAEAKKIAAAAFNVTSLSGIQAAITAAEELKQPLILSFCNSVHGGYNPLKDIGPVCVALAERSSAPICVHLDHSESFAEIREALEIGFTGVMYDGSMFSYEENLANTKFVVELAEQYGAQVEAELGAMARDEYESVDRTAHDADEACFTDPDQAAEFAEETGIAGLACSFGTVHGLYLKKPNLDFGRISALYEKMNCAVVMHGGSGLSDEETQECIRRGVRKINYYTYAAKEAGRYIKEQLEKNPDQAYSHFINVWERESMTASFLEAMKVFSNLK